MAGRILEHHVNHRAFTAVAIHFILLRADRALTRAFANGQVTARESVERHNFLSILNERLIGADPRYLAARLRGAETEASR